METDKPKSSYKKEITIGAGEAHLYGLLFLIPLIFIFAIPYYYFWTEQFTMAMIKKYFLIRDNLSMGEIGIGIFVLLIGIVLHELLHGLGWMTYANSGWKSIKFGINWKFLTPYCHCTEPLKLKAYRFGSLLPAIVLGIFPMLVAMCLGDLLLMAFGFFFTFAASGDFLILWLIRKEKSSIQVQDHPEKIGCIIYGQEQ